MQEMKTIDDVEPEIDADEVDEDWGQDVEQDDASSACRGTHVIVLGRWK